MNPAGFRPLAHRLSSDASRVFSSSSKEERVLIKEVMRRYLEIQILEETDPELLYRLFVLTKDFRYYQQLLEVEDLPSCCTDPLLTLLERKEADRETVLDAISADYF